MTHDDCKVLFAYNRWANDRTLGAAEQLTEEQLHRDLKSSFPSVYGTLVHVLSAEWIWLERWHGRSPSSYPAGAALRSLGDVRTAFAEVGQAQRVFVDGLDPVALTARIAYRNLRGEPFEDPLGFTLQHVVNHSTYHRGQIATMLRQLGSKPEGTDYITYVRQAL